MIISLGDKRAGLMLLVHVYVYLAFVLFFLSFSLPLGVGGWLRIVIRARPGRFI